MLSGVRGDGGQQLAATRLPIDLTDGDPTDAGDRSATPIREEHDLIRAHVDALARRARTSTRLELARAATAASALPGPRRSSAVVVSVATTCSVLSSTASRVVGRHAGDRVARDHDLVAAVDRVEREVGHADVDRHADADDRRDAEVAQDRIELRAASSDRGRGSGRARCRRGRRRSRRAPAPRRCPGDSCTGALLHAEEQPGVAVGALAVVARLGGAVQHRDAGRARRRARAARSARPGRPRPPPRRARAAPTATRPRRSAPPAARARCASGATSAARSSGIAASTLS